MELLTADKIRHITFTPGRGNTYRDTDVDDFVDQCADTVQALTARIDELNQKMEVLADKLVEYRNEEDSIRSALLSAQRLGDSIVREAKQKAELMLDDARIKADKIKENARREIGDEELELKRIQKEVSDFKAKLLDMYRQHLSLIDLLPEVKEEDVPAAAEPVAEAPASADVAPAAEVPQQPETEAAPAAEVSDASAESGEEPVSEEVSLVDSLWKPDDAFTPEEESELEDETPVSRFGELKFGKDYEVNSAFKRRK